MTSISIPDVLTTIYVLVDDWYQQEMVKVAKTKRGAKAVFSNSEVITLMVAQDYIPYPSETQFVEYIRANHLKLFPKLLTQSQFNRRARSLRMEAEQLRRYLIAWLGVTDEADFLLDTKPIPVMGYKRYKGRSDFAGSASYGVCKSRNLKYFGYKLVCLVTPEGIPAVYDLVPANTDERLAAEAVVFDLRGCTLLGDKGFIGEDWQASIFQHTGNQVYTPKRANQFKQNSPEFDRWLNATRERIEGAFHELQNTGRNLERLLAKTIVGLCTRVCAKLTSHALRLLLHRVFGINIQTFQVGSA